MARTAARRGVDRSPGLPLRLWQRLRRMPLRRLVFLTSVLVVCWSLVSVLVLGIIVSPDEMPQVGAAFCAVHPWRPFCSCVTFLPNWPTVAGLLSRACCQREELRPHASLACSNAGAGDTACCSSNGPLVAPPSGFSPYWRKSEMQAFARGVWPSWPVSNRWKRFLQRYPRFLEQFYDDVADADQAPWNKYRFDTCAVVGAAGRLVMYPHGKEIDAHDAVFRFNFAPTKGYEDLAGSRTDFRFLGVRNTALLTEPERRANFTLEPGIGVFISPSIDAPAVHIFKHHWLLYQAFRNISSPLFQGSVHQMYRLTQDMASWTQCSLMQRHVDAEAPSAGLYGILMAGMMCNKVDVYGYGFLKPEHCYHYYSTFPVNKMGPDGDCQWQYDYHHDPKNIRHNFNNELELIQWWASQTPCLRFVY